MKRTKILKGITVYTLALLLAAPFTVLPAGIQVSAAEDSQVTFRAEELEQMLASIALYPDALLAQVLSAATYPLEVVEAARFAKKNPGLKGDALLEAAKDKDWEPSVKAMLGFPDVLAMMDEQLEWTRTLGEAFLLQQQDCMDAVQRLRQRAYAQGNLTTSSQQVIVVDPQTQIIIIKPANAKIVYVPVYDPTVIYGVWWYPAYPPYYFYPRRYFGIRFFSGIFVGLYWGTWGCNWHHHHVYVNTQHYRTFTKTYYHRGDYGRFYKAGRIDQPWRYDSRRRHRSGYSRSFTVKPGVSVAREYQKTTTRKVTSIAKESSGPASISSTQRARVRAKISSPVAVNKEVESTSTVKSSRQRRNIRTNVKSAPAVAPKRVLKYRKSTDIQAEVESATNTEKQKAAPILTSNHSAKVAKPSLSKDRAKSVMVKRTIKVEQVGPAKALSRNKVKAKAKDFSPEDIGKSSREQMHPRNQVPASIRGSSGLPEGLIGSFRR